MAGKFRPKQMVDGEITLAKMAANSVDSDQYVDDSIDNAHLAASSVSGSAAAGDNVIEPASIDTAEIANDAVDNDKIDLADNYTWVGAHDLTGGTVTVATPIVAADAATKAYVDQVAIAGKAFHCGDRLTISPHRELAAGIHRFAIHEHCASAALTSITTYLGAGQLQMIS